MNTNILINANQSRLGKPVLCVNGDMPEESKVILVNEDNLIGAVVSATIVEIRHYERDVERAKRISIPIDSFKEIVSMIENK